MRPLFRVAIIWLQLAVGTPPLSTVIVRNVTTQLTDVGDPLYDELVIHLDITVKNEGQVALRLGKEAVVVTAIDRLSDDGKWERVATPFSATLGDLKYAPCDSVLPGAKYELSTSSTQLFLEKSNKTNWRPGVVRFGLRDYCQEGKDAISVGLLTGAVKLPVTEAHASARDEK